MKKRNILRRILAVVLVLTMATGLTAQAKGDASSTSLKEAQKEKAALEKQLKAAKELINDLKKQDQTSFLENETDYVQSGGAYLSKLLKEHHLQPGNLIRDLELERSYAYQILRGTRKPTRILLLRIGFYLQLSLSEFQRMLSICQRAILYPRNRFDAAIIYALEHNMSIDDLNDLLEEIGEPPLR